MTWVYKSLPEGKKWYFASDFHLGAPDYISSRQREDKVIRWLNSISHQADTIFLVGDIFDFWFEYKYVVPKYFVRLLGKLAELSDRGINIEIFTGNHDMWLFNYLEQEIGVTIHRQPIELKVGEQTFLVGHGDGLGKGDYAYKVLKKIFRNRLCQWLFHWLHPDVGHWIAHKWSKSSRISSHKDEHFLGPDEWLWGYCQEIEATKHHDFYIFGHRHLPLDLPVGNHARYINLGEWLNHCLYAEYDGQTIHVIKFE